jgi:glycerophosphoryl diester phosphodiesterase
MNKILIAGHRGSCEDYPENTIPSFHEAIECGADMIETDIHMTLDRELVLIHDHTVDRTTDGIGAVKDMNLADLKRLDAGSFKGNRFTGTRIPTLGEFLDSVRSNTQLLFNFELKDYPEIFGTKFCYESIDRVIAMIQEYQLEDRCVINSFSAFVLEYVDREYQHSFKLHGFYPYKFMKDQQRDPSEYLYCACIFDKTPCPRKEWFDELIENGIEPWLGAGVKVKEDFETAVQYGGRLFTTDKPAEAIRILKDLGLRE